MTVVEKNCDNCDRDRNGDEVHPTVILPQKGSIHKEHQESNNQIKIAQYEEKIYKTRNAGA